MIALQNPAESIHHCAIIGLNYLSKFDNSVMRLSTESEDNIQ